MFVVRYSLSYGSLRCFYVLLELNVVCFFFTATLYSMFYCWQFPSMDPVSLSLFVEGVAVDVFNLFCCGLL